MELPTLVCIDCLSRTFDSSHNPLPVENVIDCNGPDYADGSLCSVVWVPTFRGGGAKYANLQNSIFVASETVSDSPVPGQFYVGMKISKVFPTNTSVVIGEEFP